MFRFSTLFTTTENELNVSSFWPNHLTTGYANTHTVPGALVLLPNCGFVDPIVNFYGADCKVLASNLNPLPLLLAEAQLTHIAKDTLTEQFIQLGDLMKAGQPLRQQLDALYKTTCPHCNTTLTADYFVWQRDLADPKEKWINCTACEFVGLATVNQADLDQLDQIETRGVHYYFLLGRVVSLLLADDSAIRAKFEALHDLYTPRALYVIAEIIMKLDAMISDKAIQRVFRAILYRCLLLASSLHRDPTSVHLPKRLQQPVTFIERNVWRLFEASVSAWKLPDQQTRISRRMDDFTRRHQNSVQFFPDTENMLARYLPDEAVSLVMTAPPNPTPNIWALSTLWAGWLMGLKSAEVSYPLLTQAWPDWSWYQQSVCESLQALKPSLRPDARWVFAFTQTHRLQPAAVVLAALQSGYEVDSWEIDVNFHEITLTTTLTYSDAEEVVNDLQAAVQQEVKDTATGMIHADEQPILKGALIWSIWQSLLYSGLLTLAVQAFPTGQALIWVDQQISEILPP